MPLSGNNFAKDQPTVSSNAFADDNPTVSANSFTRDRPEKSLEFPEGENMGGGTFGGSESIFGPIYGQSPYGGISHFKNRTTSTPSH